MKLLLVVACIAALYSTVVAQQTVSLTPTQDNTLYESATGSTSNGVGIYLFAGRTKQDTENKRRIVVKFDAAANLPVNATIISAKLKMHLSKSTTGSSNVRAHRLTGDWGEGTSNALQEEGKGATATTNDATWIHKKFNTESWVSPGGDFISSASATTPVSGSGFYEWQDTLLLADVKVWQQNPEVNFGWILIGNESAQSSKRFDSKENGTVANRPQLIIEYSTPTTVQNGSVHPEVFSLQQNFPNPFNPSTSITFSLSQSGSTILKVFDILGNDVATIVNRHLSAGTHSVELNASNLTTGVYFYRLQSGSYSSTKKLMLLK